MAIGLQLIRHRQDKFLHGSAMNVRSNAACANRKPPQRLPDPAWIVPKRILHSMDRRGRHESSGQPMARQRSWKPTASTRRGGGLLIRAGFISCPDLVSHVGQGHWSTF